MLPYLKEGDIVFFKKYKKNKSILKYRQIVIFNHPLKNKNLIKRISSVNQNNINVIGDNEAPVAAENIGFSVEEGTSLTILEAELLDDASDSDEDTLHIASISSQSGSLTLVENGAAIGSRSWIFEPPDDNFTGDISLSFDVSDGSLVDSASAVVTITPINDVPTSDDTVTFVMAEDGSLSITESQLLGASYDVDGDDIHVDAL